MKQWIIGALMALAAGCGTGGTTNDAAGGDAVSPTDTASGGVACGATTCAVGQVCVEPCQLASCSADAGGVACPAPFCFTPPTSCGTSHACTCLGTSDPCNTDHTFASLGVCTDWSNRIITCGMCD